MPLDRAAGDVAHRVATASGARDARGLEVGEDVRQLGELEPVELDALPGRQLGVAAAVPVRDLADRAQLRRREDSARDLHAEHERPDLRLVVVEAPPLEADDVFLRHRLVPGGDQRGQLLPDPERRPVTLDPLDGVALVDGVPGRGGCHPPRLRVITLLREVNCPVQGFCPFCSHRQREKGLRFVHGSPSRPRHPPRAAPRPSPVGEAAATYPSPHPWSSAPEGGVRHVDAVPQVPPVRDRRTARPHAGPTSCSARRRSGARPTCATATRRSSTRWTPRASGASSSCCVALGIKEIEVGFPAASETDFDFVRTLDRGGR